MAGVMLVLLMVNMLDSNKSLSVVMTVQSMDAIKTMATDKEMYDVAKWAKVVTGSTTIRDGIYGEMCE